MTRLLQLLAVVTLGALGACREAAATPRDTTEEITLPIGAKMIGTPVGMNDGREVWRVEQGTFVFVRRVAR